MKTIVELSEKLEKLEENLFYLEMKDHWTQEDFKQADALQDSIKDLKTRIATLTRL